MYGAGLNDVRTLKMNTSHIQLHSKTTNHRHHRGTCPRQATTIAKAEQEPMHFHTNDTTFHPSGFFIILLIHFIPFMGDDFLRGQYHRRDRKQSALVRIGVRMIRPSGRLTTSRSESHPGSADPNDWQAAASHAPAHHWCSDRRARNFLLRKIIGLREIGVGKRSRIGYFNLYKMV